MQLRTGSGTYSVEPIVCDKCGATVEGVIFERQGLEERLSLMPGDISRKPDNLVIRSPLGAAIWDALSLTAYRR